MLCKNPLRSILICHSVFSVHPDVGARSLKLNVYGRKSKYLVHTDTERYDTNTG